jgi:DNA-binding LacI/PurR family transcriptional regulator
MKRSVRVTIVDVARAAGTSVSSASVALRGEPGVSERTRSRIQDIADRLGYQPDQRARVLREHQSKLLGVTFSVDSTFHMALVDHLYRAAAPTGYDLVLSATTSTRPDPAAVQSLLRERCSTLVLISPAIDAEQLSELAERTPVITVASDLNAVGVDSVRSDDRRGIAEAVGHLAGLGHRSITYVDGGTAVMSAIRRDGYLTAMAEQGLAAHARVLAAHPTEEAGVQAAQQLLDRGDLPTAVLTHNDQIAFGLLLTLRQQGITVPGQVSVVGFDDTRLATLPMIRLTSVSQDARRLAHTAVDRAIARVEEPSRPAEEFVAAPTLVVRDTAGPPPR